MASNPVVLDGLLHLLAVLAILSAVGGSPAYNVALALYGILGLYSRIPRALLSLLVLVGVSFVADIVQLSVNHGIDFSGSTLSYGTVMTIIMLLMKLPLALFVFKCFSELGGMWSQPASGNASAGGADEYYGMAGADSNAQSFAGQDGQA